MKKIKESINVLQKDLKSTDSRIKSLEEERNDVMHKAKEEILKMKGELMACIEELERRLPNSDDPNFPKKQYTYQYSIEPQQNLGNAYFSYIFYRFLPSPDKISFYFIQIQTEKRVHS